MRFMLPCFHSKCLCLLIFFGEKYYCFIACCYTKKQSVLMTPLTYKKVFRSWSEELIMWLPTFTLTKQAGGKTTNPASNVISVCTVHALRNQNNYLWIRFEKVFSSLGCGITFSDNLVFIWAMYNPSCRPWCKQESGLFSLSIRTSAKHLNDKIILQLSHDYEGKSTTLF